LISLDLTSFNVSNVTNVNYMFCDCSSLQTIYSKNWNVIRGDMMFSGCPNLRGGQGTKVGENLYGYDTNGEPLYYNCPYGGPAAHIDGGKDNPGLFTAK
jgi:surface protein